MYGKPPVFIAESTTVTKELIHYLFLYIKGCHICQFTHNEKPPTRQIQTRTGFYQTNKTLHLTTNSTAKGTTDKLLRSI